LGGWKTGGALWRESLISYRHKTIYISEGGTDAITLVSAGLEDDGHSLVVALPSATSGITNIGLFVGKHVCLCLDDDEAGRKAAVRLAAILKPTARSVRIEIGVAQ
jgi:DNA primase